jgi:hypothetical protein
MTYAEYLKNHIEKVLPKSLKSFEDKNGFSLPEFSIDEIFALPKSSYFTKNIIRFGNVMMTVSVKEKDNRMGRLKKFLERILEGVLGSLDYQYEAIYIDFVKTKKADEEFDLLPQVSYLFKVYKPKWVENYSVEETKTDDTTFFDFYIQVDPTDWDDRKTNLESINQGEDLETLFEKKLIGYYWHQLSDIFDNKIDKFINIDGDKFYGYKFIIERSNVGTVEESKHTDEKESKKLEKNLIVFFKEELPNVLDFELTKLIKNEKSDLVILKGDLKIKSNVESSDKKLYQILKSDKLKDIIKNIKLIYKTITPKDFNLNVDIDVKYSTRGKLTEQLTNGNLGNLIKSYDNIKITGDTMELGLGNLNLQKPDDFIKFLTNSPLKLNVYNINSEGYNFNIYPVSLTHNNFKISFEPLAPNKLLLVTFKKQFGSKKKVNESKEREVYLINKLIDPDKEYTHSDSFYNSYDDVSFDVKIYYKIKLTDVYKNESPMGYSVKLLVDIQRILVGIEIDDTWESMEKDDIPSWIFDNIQDEIIDKFDNFLPSVYVNDIEYV